MGPNLKKKRKKENTCLLMRKSLDMDWGFSVLAQHTRGTVTWKGGTGMSGSQDPHFTRLPPRGRGPSTFFFGGYVLRGFPKVGSRERVFLKKWEVLGAKIHKVCILRAEIWPKTRLKMHFFSQKIANGGHVSAHWWQIGRLGSVGWPEKWDRVMTAAHPHTPFLG